MKICWDNLEKLEYIGDNIWREVKTTNYYIYKDACKNCGEPFLANKYRYNVYCGYVCSALNREYTEENRRKNSEAHKGLQIGDKNPSWKGGYASNNIPFYDTFAHQISFCEKVRRNEEDSNILEVTCAYCGKWFIPKLTDVFNRLQVLKGNKSGGNRFYCSEPCKLKCPVYKQILWPKGFRIDRREVQPELRQMCLESDDYTCQICGKKQAELKTGLCCHHIEGVYQNPIESADLDNVITLCKECHKKVHALPGCGYHDMKCKNNKE